MRKLLLLLIVFLYSGVLFSQNDSILIGNVGFLTPCNKKVYFVYELLLEGEYFCEFLMKHPIKYITKKRIHLNDSSKLKYPNYDLKNYIGIEEIEILSLIIFNGKELITNEDKESLSKIKQEDIKNLQYIEKCDARKKYGKKKGRYGAVIITTY
jgi:hypothetical protein